MSDNTTNGEIAYGVVAGVMWLLWMAVIAIAYKRSRAKPAGPTQGIFEDKPKESTERMRAPNTAHQQASPKSSTLRPSDEISSATKPTHG